MAEKRLRVYLALRRQPRSCLSVKTIRRRITDGKIPAYQCGRRPTGSTSTTLKPLCADSFGSVLRATEAKTLRVTPAM